MAKNGKRYRKMKEATKDQTYSLNEAVAFFKNNAKCKFNETVEVAINLNVDPRKADQNIRGMVTMPAGTGKKVVVAVFAKGVAADQAKTAGADFVGAEDLVEKFQNGTIKVDMCIATPDMMGVVGRIGKILGPLGIMPNPKLGTVTANVTAAVSTAKSGQVEYRLDKAGIVHAGICALDFEADKIEANIKAFVGTVVKAKPAAVKSGYLKKVTLSTTMGVGLRLDLSEVYTF